MADQHRDMGRLAAQYWRDKHLFRDLLPWRESRRERPPAGHEAATAILPDGRTDVDRTDFASGWDEFFAGSQKEA